MSYTDEAVAVAAAFHAADTVVSHGLSLRVMASVIGTAEGKAEIIAEAEALRAALIDLEFLAAPEPEG
jgi:hypothetical protein